MSTPKSLLRKRTEAQFAFDWGVKGWAFTDKELLPQLVERAVSLYEAIGFSDPKRLAVVEAIKDAAK